VETCRCQGRAKRVYRSAAETLDTTRQVRNYTFTKRLEEIPDRLSGVRIKTNIKTGGKEEIANFGFLDWWHMVVDEPMATVQVKLSDWLYRAITNLEVLTLSKDYFRLDGGIERRMYELCRKHCGNQETWSIHLPLL
jgi:plasmid replication initiation protein